MFETNKIAAEYLADSYSVSLEKCQKEAKLSETPIEVAIRENAAASLQKAENIIKMGILSEEALSEYHRLEKEITEKKAYLKKLYGIEAGELSLKALDEAILRYTDEYKAALDKENEETAFSLQTLEEDFLTQKENIKTQKEKAMSEIEIEIDNLNSSFNKEFAREQAEYEYNLARSRKSVKDERASLVSEREQKLKDRETLAEKEKEDCIGRIAEIDAMEKEVENIDAVIADARNRGAEEEEKILNKSFQYQKELDDSDHKHDVQALKAKYDNLKIKYDQLCAEIHDINSRLDQCNVESRKLTSDTVRSIGGINILNPDRNNRAEG